MTLSFTNRPFCCRKAIRKVKKVEMGKAVSLVIR